MSSRYKRKLKRKIIKRWRHKCFVCHEPVTIQDTLEHILPKCLGGTNKQKNLAISHYRCNWARNAAMIRLLGDWYG